MTLAAGRSFVMPQRLDQAGIAELHCSADQGLVSAQVALAHKYETGQDVPLDVARAITLYERAASSVPRTTAIYSPPVTLGGKGQVLFFNNPDSRPGSAEAQYRLGLLLRRDQQPHNQKRARALIGRAAEQGYRPAIEELESNP